MQKITINKTIKSAFTFVIVVFLSSLALVGYADIFEDSHYAKAILGFITILMALYILFITDEQEA